MSNLDKLMLILSYPSIHGVTEFQVGFLTYSKLFIGTRDIINIPVSKLYLYFRTLNGSNY